MAQYVFAKLTLNYLLISNLINKITEFTTPMEQRTPNRVTDQDPLFYSSQFSKYFKT